MSEAVVLTSARLGEWVRFLNCRSLLARIKAGMEKNVPASEVLYARQVVGKGLSFDPLTAIRRAQRDEEEAEEAPMPSPAAPLSVWDMDYSEAVERCNAMHLRRDLTPLETTEFFRLCDRAKRGY